MKSILAIVFVTVVLSGAAVLIDDNHPGLEPPTEDSSKPMRQNNERSTGQNECTTLAFRFVEFENELYSPNLRHIELFLDVREFNESNLRNLFNFLTRKYPDPENLTVVVNTDWNQLPRITDCPLTAMSNSNAPLEQTEYHQAIFYRRKGKRPDFKFNLKLDQYT